MLCTSGFTGDVTFAHTSTARRLLSSCPFVDRHSATGLSLSTLHGRGMSAVARPSYTVISRFPTRAQDISVQALLA